MTRSNGIEATRFVSAYFCVVYFAPVDNRHICWYIVIICWSRFALNEILLLARGYSEDKIKPIFLKAARIFEEKLLKQKVNHREQQRCNEFELRKERKERIFLHFQYHPKDVSRQRIQTLFHNTCLSTKNEHSLQCLQDSSPPEGNGGTLTIKRATVAYSRAPNIRDKVSPSTLFQPPGLNVSDVIKDHM